MFRTMFARVYTQNAQPTFAELAEAWIVDAEPRLSPKWHLNCARILRKEVLPSLGELRADQIGRRDVAQLVEGLSARSRGIANHSLGLVGNIYRWSMANGRVGDEVTDPTKGVRKNKMSARERVLSEAELRLVWQASGELASYGRILRLLLLTGCRREEIGGLRWAEVELEREGGPVIALPASRVKNKRAHLVPLSQLALAQLPARREGYPQVFGVRRAKGHSGWSQAKKELDGLICVAAPWKVHDLRRTFVTHCAELGLAEPHIIEAAVNHVSGSKGGVAGVYNRATHLAERRALLEKWSEHVVALVGGRPQA